MERENQTKMWIHINKSQKDARSKSIFHAQRMVEGEVEEATTKEEAEQFIFDETGLRFQLAKDAPLSKTLLIDDLGYLADTDTARQILNGTFPIPDEVDDITTIILEEIGRIGGLTQSGGIDSTVTPDDFRYFWRRVKERTSSSLSGIHFGHYKAAASSETITNFLAKKITLVGKCGCPPERWSYGMTVMLEKVAGIAMVNKLRAILLMEADFNFHNKLVFGVRMIAEARAKGLIHPEQFAEKQCTA